MAFFTDTTSCAAAGAKVVLPVEKQVFAYTLFSNDTSNIWRRTVTTTKTEFRGLTTAAVNTAVTTYAAQSPKSTPLGGGGHTLKLVSDSESAWVEDT